MAIKLRYPSWNDWQKGIEFSLADAVDNSELTDYRLNGASTSAQVSIKSPDEMTGNMPYVSTALTDVQEGWDDEGSGVLDYESHTYTSLGGTKSIKQTNFYRERLTWTIEIYAQKYTAAIEVAQAVRRYFGPHNTFTINYRDENIDAISKLSEYSIFPAEDGREGKTEFFLASWELTLSIKSDLITADEITKNVAQVTTDIVVSAGINDSDELTKTIS